MTSLLQVVAAVTDCRWDILCLLSLSAITLAGVVGGTLDRDLEDHLTHSASADERRMRILREEDAEVIRRYRHV